MASRADPAAIAPLLTSADWALLAGDDDAEALHAAAARDPAALEAALSAAPVRDALFGEASGQPAGIASVSPALLFAVAATSAADDLRHARYVEEWVGARTRLPVLGVDDLRELLGDATWRARLVSLLLSFTRVASGVSWRRGRRGWRRRRFSELDPLSVAAVLEDLPPERRPALRARLGDLALFLTGVFPDYAAGRAFRPIDVHRLGHAAAITRPDLAESLASRGGVGLLEGLGPRWYRLASEADASTPARARELADPERFAQARRALDLITHRYLFARRARLFPAP